MQYIIKLRLRIIIKKWKMKKQHRERKTIKLCTHTTNVERARDLEIEIYPHFHSLLIEF